MIVFWLNWSTCLSTWATANRSLWNCFMLHSNVTTLLSSQVISNTIIGSMMRDMPLEEIVTSIRHRKETHRGRRDPLVVVIDVKWLSLKRFDTKSDTKFAFIPMFCVNSLMKTFSFGTKWSLLWHAMANRRVPFIIKLTSCWFKWRLDAFFIFSYTSFGVFLPLK